MDFIYILFLVGFFGGILCFAAACGAYTAISKKLDNIADKYREDNLRLTAQLDRANVKARRYQTELDQARKEYFIANNNRNTSVFIGNRIDLLMEDIQDLEKKFNL